MGAVKRSLVAVTMIINVEEKGMEGKGSEERKRRGKRIRIRRREEGGERE